MIAIILIAITLGIVGLYAIRFSSVSLNYPRITDRMSPEELQSLRNDLDEEAGQFLEQVHGKPHGAWGLGEIAWYESIRRREALYY